MDNHLHIVTHQVPWPVLHGGIVDLFYKLVALKHAGIQIHLHCFTSNNKTEPALDRYCTSINYYQRKTGLRGLSTKLPYIVSSRKSHQLLINLLKDKYPILLDGIHCTWVLFTGKLEDRKVFVRLHNVENNYYHRLAKAETNFFKKIYYYTDSALLKKYEAGLANKSVFLTVSRLDANYYSKILHAYSVHFLPVFLPYNTVSSKTGSGNYCLYHGNLSVSENEKAALWLLKHVFNELNIPFVIAGRCPSSALRSAVKMYTNSCLVSDPDEDELQDLISKAHINILPSFNNTGVKLKLLNALYNGRFCVTNDAGIEGAVLKDLCFVGNTAAEIRTLILELIQKSFNLEDIQHRQSELQGVYDNEKNALHLKSLIW